MQRHRVAIYGGTFDPVHNGHLEVARGVVKLFEIDELMFVPAYVPPHKRNLKLTSAFHRFAMLALATQADQRLLVSTIELDTPDRPYAVDTVERMLRPDWRVFFLIGADSWNEITTWFEWQRLLKLCDVIVVTRPGYEIGRHVEADVEVIDLRGLESSQAREQISKDVSPRVFVSDVAMVGVSATAIRASARAEQVARLKEIVPEAVADYISKHELYRN